MALPESRNTTYVLGVSQVKAADLNDLQDHEIAIYKLTGPVRHLNLGKGFAPLGETLPDHVTQNIWESNGGINTAIYFALELPVGAIVESIDLEFWEGTSDAATAQIEEWDAGSMNQLGDTITTGTSGGLVTHTWDDTTNDSVGEIPFTVAAGKQYMIRIDFPDANNEHEIRDIKITLEYNA